MQSANFTDTCFAVDAVPEMPCTDALDEHSSMFFIANVLLILARDKERRTKGNRRIAGAVVLEYRLPATSVSV